jgi:hypothetical protein
MSAVGPTIRGVRTGIARDRRLTGAGLLLMPEELFVSCSGSSPAAAESESCMDVCDRGCLSSHWLPTAVTEPHRPLHLSGTDVGHCAQTLESLNA